MNTGKDIFNVSGSRVSFETELQIGTDFYLMKNNRAIVGIVAEIEVNITTCTEQDRSWYDQLFDRWRVRKQKDTYSISVKYNVKIEGEIMLMSIEKRNGAWYFLDSKIYFSLDKLKQTT